MGLGRVVENKCIMAYDDTTGEMAKAFDSPLCNFDCYSGTYIYVFIVTVVLGWRTNVLIMQKENNILNF